MTRIRKNTDISPILIKVHDIYIYIYCCLAHKGNIRVQNYFSSAVRRQEKNKIELRRGT